MKRTILICLALFLYIPFSFTQIVETVISHSEIRDGLHVDPFGNIYTTSGGLAGFEIGKYDIQTEMFNPLFAIGFFGPVDVDIYQDSLLIVTNYDNNTVSAYNLNTGQRNVIASGLDGPAGIVIDSNDNIFVTSWGGAPNYAGHRIHRISPSGAVSLYVDSPLLYRPQAITVNHEGKLLVHSQGKIYDVNPVDSTLQLWLDVGTEIGHMILRQKDSCIYGTAIGDDQIIKISPQGTVDVIAGSTQGYQDGAAESAKFREPLGIEFSPDEDTLYVSEAGYTTNTGRLRRIILSEAPVSALDLNFRSIKISPNPTNGEFIIDQGLDELVMIEVFDSVGKRVLSKSGNSQKISIDLSQQTHGLYIVKLSYKEGTVVKKVLKINYF